MDMFEELTIERGDNEDSAALCFFEVRDLLKESAEASMRVYAELSSGLVRDMVDKYGFSDHNVRALVRRNALELAEAIKRLK